MHRIKDDVNALIAEMKGLSSFGDDLFIELLDREEALQERLEAEKKAGRLSEEDFRALSEKLEEAMGELRGKLSFCSLS